MVRLCILALALFQQGSSPVPRSPQPTVSKQESTNTNQQNARQNKQNADHVTSSNEESSVRVVSLPPVTTTRDFPSFIVSVVLAVVGIIGVVIGVCTLRTIRKQVSVM